MPIVTLPSPSLSLSLSGAARVTLNRMQKRIEKEKGRGNERAFRCVALTATGAFHEPLRKFISMAFLPATIQPSVFLPAAVLFGAPLCNFSAARFATR